MLSKMNIKGVGTYSDGELTIIWGYTQAFISIKFMDEAGKPATTIIQVDIDEFTDKLKKYFETEELLQKH